MIYRNVQQRGDSRQKKIIMKTTNNMIISLNNNFFEGKSYYQTTTTGLLQNTGTDNVIPVISLSPPDMNTGIIYNKPNAR